MKPKDHILARLYVVLTVLCLLPAGVALQVVRIHLGDGAALRAQGQRQARSYVGIPAMRGAILDREGRTLAVNAARYDLALDPTVSGFAREASSFFEKLSRLTRTSAATLRRKVDRRASPKYVLLLRGLTEPQKEAVEAWDVPGVILEPTFARRYNYDHTAAHLLGHVDTDGTGLGGLEKQYDDVLRGEPGQRAVQRDRRGIIKAAVAAPVVEPKHGETIVLTIDLVRQTILEEELARGVEASGATWGAAVAMDPYTGALLALGSVPTFNPNRAAAYSADARRNRPLTDRMEPGSTFKLVGAVAAVEEGLITPDDTVDTGQGWASFGGRPMRDSHGYGRIPFREVIAKSSNVGTAQVVTQLDPGVFYQYARNLGFGQPTWVDLPGEVGGTLKRPDTWSRTSHSRMAIGYEVAVTPLQLLTAYSALANGGLLMKPYLVAERRDLTGRVLWRAEPDAIRRAFSRQTAAALLPAFEGVVEDGTAEQAQVDGLRIAGKTGTARKADGSGYQPGAYRATFVGFFPADDPQVALVVVMDEPKGSVYGGAVAAPVFGRIAQRWLATLPIVAARIAPPKTLPPPVVAPPTLPPVPPDTLLPNFTGRTVREAAAWLQARGVGVRVDGHGMIVRQEPVDGSALPDNVTLYGQPR